jgi:ATP-binding cassette subfamily F protein 3
VAVVVASALRKEIAGASLFDRVTFKAERRERVALMGPNGAGKTTLLRILAGELTPDAGEIAFEKGTRVALHDQRPPLGQGLSLRDYLLAGGGLALALEEELGRLEQAMARGADDATTLRRYGATQAQFEHAGGYAWREHAVATARGLGFGDEDLGRPLSTFSGGELTRASLARALAGNPDLLLLDEPTNHLDVAGLEWLENELTHLNAAIVLVAHDRWFLEAVTTATLELVAGRSTFFAGPWHAWRREKAERAAHALRTSERLQADISRLERFVARFRYKKTKAKQAQAKLTQIARLERERGESVAEHELLTRSGRRLGFGFAEPKRSGRVVLEIEGATIGAGDRVLARDVSLALERGDRVALVGPNGSGKTTILVGIVAGHFRLGHAVEIGYFAQHTVSLDERGNALEAVQHATGLHRPEAQSLLGRFLFSGWDAHAKPVAALSGGERRRLALAILVASGVNFLVLDEPTNHLDLESREALEEALDAFAGTVLLVSHDRALVDAVADRVAVLEEGTLRTYEGGWAEYARIRAERPEAPKAPSRPAKGLRGEQRPAADPLARIEAEIEAQERLVAELEAALAEDWSDADKIAAHRRARDELQALFARWESLVGQ